MIFRPLVVGRPEAYVHVVVVARPGHDDLGGTAKSGRAADEDHLRAGSDESIEEILREFPQLRPAEVHDALSYYYDYRAEIEQEIAELTALKQAMQQYPPTLRPPDNDRHQTLS